MTTPEQLIVQKFSVEKGEARAYYLVEILARFPKFLSQVWKKTIRFVAPNSTMTFLSTIPKGKDLSMETRI